MKKSISFVLWSFFALSLFWFSFSDSVLDYISSIWNNILFGYTPSLDKISIENITTTSVTIKSPVLKDEFNDIINNYTLMYGPNTLDQIIANPTLIANSKEKHFSNLSLAWQTTFTMTLNTADTINPNIVYYVMAVPKDTVGTLWAVSNELCFKLNGQLTWEGTACVDWVWNMHDAWADMSLANISHTINGNTINLKWIAVNGSDKVDIFLWNESANSFSKLATVNMSVEKYSFTTTRNGEHIVKFVPNNGGREINYTFNVVGVSTAITPVTTTSTVTPVVVWPKENVIAILIWTIVLYLVYRVVRRKA